MWTIKSSHASGWRIALASSRAASRAVRYELRQKGVENEVIDDVVADLDEEAAARAALESKMGGWQHLDRATFQKRAMGFLGRRGFNYAIVKQVCDDGWAQIEEENAAGNEAGG
ncbi:MAG: RecX family transcriptional regulator [Caldilineaceae bacterium]|nr:RecX family transcriptional regulator [Caldilineaceae bacterium]